MSTRLLTVLSLSAMLLCLPGLAQAQPDGLKHDPFARPVLALRPASAAPVPASTPVPEPVWKPELAAVMLAGPKSAVSIDGTIVRLGEEINGHRLVEVQEQAAIFVKNRKRVTLSLRGLQLVPEAPPVRKDENPTTVRPAAPPKPDERKPEEK